MKWNPLSAEDLSSSLSSNRVGLLGAVMMALLAAFPTSTRGQATNNSATHPGGSYLVAYRTPQHRAFSKPGVFHAVADNVEDLLKTKHVLLVADPERPKFQTEEQFSIESLTNLAKGAGASYLLYVIVDRPASNWLKVTIQCYDLEEKLLWEESAGSGIMAGPYGKNAPRKTLAKLEKQLGPRFGGPGLPLVPGASQ